MWQLLWLLLPLAALSGGWAGYRVGQQPSRGSSKFSREYFQGLNYLLNEQPDQAIEVFTRMVELDEDTVETHLTLGNLFRRRGEADRAVRIHQNLIARPSLRPEQRASALVELARDYQAAGLLDRAETLFLEALEFNDYRTIALQALLDIYQQEKEWESAIDMACRLQRISARDLGPLMAQFVCEQAEQRWREHGEAADIRQPLRRALRYDPHCARASLLQCDIDQQAGRWRSAIKACQRVESQDSEYIPEILPRLEACYQAIGTREQFATELYRLVHRYPGVAVVIKLSELIESLEGRKQAIDFLAMQLRERPSVQGLDRLIALHMGSDDTDHRRQRDLKALRELFAALMGDQPPYRCVDCGFETRQIHWQCPGCRAWATIKPRRRLPGE